MKSQKNTNYIYAILTFIIIALLVTTCPTEAESQGRLGYTYDQLITELDSVFQIDFEFVQDNANGLVISQLTDSKGSLFTYYLTTGDKAFVYRSQIDFHTNPAFFSTYTWIDTDYVSMGLNKWHNYWDGGVTTIKLEQHEYSGYPTFIFTYQLE